MENQSILKSRLTINHVALVRGWVQGLELSDIAERYLPILGDDDGSIDLRVVKGTLVRVLDLLSANAKQLNIQGAATLSRQASRIRINAKAPTLEDFAETLECPDFYSEAELAQLYVEKYSQSDNAGARSQARRSRLVSRQIALLNELQSHVHAPVSLHDDIPMWFEDSLSERIASIEAKTILDLCVIIVRNRTSWWESMPGVGIGKAKRIQNFLLANWNNLEDVVANAGIQAFEPMQLSFQDKAQIALLELSKSEGNEVQSVEFLPEANLHAQNLNGSKGRLRGLEQSATSAQNDHEAMETWLKLKASGKTVTLYRREVQRIMMWATLEMKKPLSSLSIEDALLYRSFVQDVPAHWVSKKGTPQDDPRWTPFIDSLSTSSTKKAFVIIHGFFAWLVTTGYCTANPFAGVKVHLQTMDTAQASTKATDDGSLKLHKEKAESIIKRALPHSAILAVEKTLSAREQDETTVRARFIFKMAYQTGMRISEIAAARMDHLKQIESTSRDEGGWVLSVLGKRNKLREVPIPNELIADLIAYFQIRGLPGLLSQVEPGVFLIGKLSNTLKKGEDKADGVTQKLIHKTLVQLFRKAIEFLAIGDESASRQLAAASTHWLRHTCATEAVASDVPLDVVASTLGHSSLSTTSRYIHTESRRRLREMNKFWKESSSRTPEPT